MIKLTVLALVTFSVLCKYEQTTSNQNLIGSSGNLQSQQTSNGMNNQYEMEEQIIAMGTVLAMILGSIVIGGINIYLCMKCLSKRSIGKKVKEQMMFKRLEFATNHGYTLQQMNDPRFSQTLHV